MTYFFKIWKYARWLFPIASVSFLLAVPYMWVGTAIMAILYPLAVLTGATAINFTLLYADGITKTLFGYLHNAQTRQQIFNSNGVGIPCR